MKVALVHDFFREWGGAEEVIKTLHEIWPEAPIFTSYVSDNNFSFEPIDNKGQCRQQENGRPTISKFRLKTSWLNYLPNSLKSSKLITPLLPFAFSSFNFSNFDVVISSSAAFAKSVDVKKPTVHICYCHTPTRFLYGLQREHVAVRQLAELSQIIEAPINAFLRWLDQQAAKRVDYFIANSHVVADRIKKFYGKDATVIYPPVEVNKFATSHEPRATSDYFLTIGRLSPVKHFKLAVEACTKLGVPLKVIGTGHHEKYLRSIAGQTVEFLGRLDDQKAAEVIAGSKALINPVIDEDFGIVPLEVLGAGKPVIAFASDAAKETMIDDKTGKLFYEATEESLARVLADFNESQYNPEDLRKHAQQFSKERFIREMKSFVESHTFMSS